MRHLQAQPAPISPLVHPDTAEFWDGLAAGELRVQVCSHCHIPRFPFAPVCFRCLSYDFEWRPIEPVGTVAAAVVVHRATGNHAWSGHTPFASGVVDMEAGLRLPGTIRCNCDAGFVRGARVEAVQIDSVEGAHLYAFAHRCLGTEPSRHVLTAVDVKRLPGEAGSRAGE